MRDFTCAFLRARKGISMQAGSLVHNRGVPSIDLCLTYPMPTSKLKDCIGILVTPIASVVNFSLSEGCFPSHIKSALVSPLLKKPTICKENLKPESSLSFLSKVVPKVAFCTMVVKGNDERFYTFGRIYRLHAVLFSLQGHAHAHHIHVYIPRKRGYGKGSPEIRLRDCFARIAHMESGLYDQ